MTGSGVIKTWFLFRVIWHPRFLKITLKLKDQSNERFNITPPKTNKQKNIVLWCPCRASQHIYFSFKEVQIWAIPWGQTLWSTSSFSSPLSRKLAFISFLLKICAKFCDHLIPHAECSVTYTYGTQDETSVGGDIGLIINCDHRGHCCRKGS